jgi:hypothetical protein
MKGEQEQRWVVAYDSPCDKRRRKLAILLEGYGVRHEDACLRNITYRQQDGRFCVIDFEFATLLDQGIGLTPVPPETPFHESN